jgi:hypothetical protein
METYFKDEYELDPEGRSLEDLEELDDSPKKESLIEEYKLKRSFLLRPDQKYVDFWEKFSDTSEIPSPSTDGSISPFERAVYDPNHPAHKQFFSGEFERDRDNLVVSIKDCFGKTTSRRVCPHCHNPLPRGYGKHAVKFISVIGVTGSGKTVYLSQLINGLSTSCVAVGLSANYLSNNEREFVERNLILHGLPLPEGTSGKELAQPLFYNLIKGNDDGTIRTDTFVIYDIAGENCVSPESMKSYGEFVLNSSGIIFIIDPSQFLCWSETRDKKIKNEKIGTPHDVLNTIYNAFVEDSGGVKCKIPIAVSISKGDKIAGDVFSRHLEAVSPVFDEKGRKLPEFNVKEHEGIKSKLKKAIEIDPNGMTLNQDLQNMYEQYDYFILSAMGIGTEIIEGTELETPAGPTNPKRIEEPLFWLFHRFGYIGPFEKPLTFWQKMSKAFAKK